MNKVKTKKIGGYSFFGWTRPYVVVVQDAAYYKELQESYNMIKSLVLKYGKRK